MDLNINRHLIVTVYIIVNDIRNFAFGLAKTYVYGFGKSRKQKFIMSFTICPYLLYAAYMQIEGR